MRDRLDAILHRKQAEYLDSILTPREAILETMEKYAADEQHPIADPDVAQMMRILARVRQPKHLLEVGTNIGYSVVVLGRELEGDALIETIELDGSILAKAKGFVTEAELKCQVIFHRGAALEVIPRLIGVFDFVFMDCVKTEYGDYLDAILPHLATGALIVCDNLLWKGLVADERSSDTNAAALRKFNRRLTTDPAFLTSILPIGDGLGVTLYLGPGATSR